VVLCERGIRTFDSYTRNCLDVGGIAALKRLTHLPVLADPSHATGRRELVVDTALAAIAGGADGLVVEAHADPGSALSDREQQLTPDELVELATRARRVALAVGRSLRGPHDADHSGERVPNDFVERLRLEISENDRGIVDAINTRLELVARMHSYKTAHGIAFRDARREQVLLESLQETNDGPLSPEGLEEILLALLDLTKREVA